MIQHNPFLSPTFKAIWCRHFASAQTRYTIDCFSGLEFTKHASLPLYTNVGKTFTKGINCQCSEAHSSDFKGKTFLIYDVPQYFESPSASQHSKLAHLKSKQYPGFLIELDGFNSLNDYLASNFSKSGRYKLKKYKKRFEASFDVRYEMYRGAIDKEKYDAIFEAFRDLLEKRFDDKQVTNNNLDPREWAFYHEVTYPMILENTAALFVIYNGDTPIGVTLNFFSKDMLFDAITVFDIDYAKFHLGSITIMALLEWCLTHEMRVFDFSKGYFDYKTRWCTKTYDFEYHIYYDKASFKAKAIATFLKKFFDVKQHLREKNYNDNLHRLTYKFKNRSTKPEAQKKYTFTELDNDTLIKATTGSPVVIAENAELRLLVFEYLYLNDGHYNELKVYPAPEKNHYYLISKTKKVLATLA